MPKRVVPMQHHDPHVGLDLAKMAPPTGILGASIMGLPVADWLQILGGVVLLMQLVIAAPKFYEVVKGWVLKIVSYWRARGQ